MKNKNGIMGITLMIALMSTSVVNAQQTIFNVPSADVLAPKTVYLENDWYVRSWKTDSDKAGTTYGRGVVGLGKSVEVGINAGPFDVLHTSNPFIYGAAKWRPILHEISGRHKPGAIGFYVGDTIGVGLHDQVKGKTSNLIYGAGFIRLPDLQTRLGIGPYYATKQFFGERRAGALATVEQPIPRIENLLVAADWFSGDGGYLTPGVIYSRWNFTLYLGYGLANTGRQDDLLTMELGYTFPPW